MSDYDQIHGAIDQTTLVEAFRQLQLLAKTTRSNGWQFKAKYYQQVADLLAVMDPGQYVGIEDTVDFVPYFQEGGMKFRGEIEHYLKKRQWKSKVLRKLDSLWKTGSLMDQTISLETLERMKAVEELCRIPELGVAKANSLFDLGFRTVENLLADTNLENVLNRKQLIGIRHFRDLKSRISRGEMESWVQVLEEVTSCQAEALGLDDVRCSMVGSYRRGATTSGDVDWYVSAPGADDLMEAIVETLVSLEMVKEEDIISKGVKKTMMIGRLEQGQPARHIDIFVFPPEQYPFALLYATGSKDFNLAMRNYALQHGWSLSDQALRKGSPQGPMPTLEEMIDRIGQTEITHEIDIFDFLGLVWVEPHMRDGNSCISKI